MGHRIEIQGKDGAFGAYVADPLGATGPAASGSAIVVIQEIFGVNHVMRDVCDWLAAEGHTAICPDLFWRIEPGIDITDRTDAEWSRAFALFKAFNVDAGAQDIQATITHLRSAGHTRVGSVGYCLGGLMAYLTSTRTDTDASVGYYGVGVDNYLGEAARIRTPLMLHVAEEDGFVSRDSQARVKAALTSPLVTLHAYPGRDHAFARVGGQHYHVGDAATANQRTVDFFATHLR
jgi:carboxymethylenebutenolidase